MVTVKPMTDNPIIRQQLKHPPKPGSRKPKEKKEVQKLPTIWAVDFDGTLTVGSQFPNIGKPNEKLIAVLKMAKLSGVKLILWTCRGGDSLNEALSWCIEQGLEWDAVNDNIPEVIAAFGSNPRKVMAHYYIDDRAFHFWGEDGIKKLCELMLKT